MAGKTLDEARAAQSAARASQKSCNPHGTTSPHANTADNGSTPITINGKCYVLDNTTTPTTETSTNSALTAITMEDYDNDEYIAVLTAADNSLTSVDWHLHS